MIVGRFIIYELSNQGRVLPGFWSVAQTTEQLWTDAQAYLRKTANDARRRKLLLLEEGKMGLDNFHPELRLKALENFFHYEKEMFTYYLSHLHIKPLELLSDQDMVEVKDALDYYHTTLSHKEFVKIRLGGDANWEIIENTLHALLDMIGKRMCTPGEEGAELQRQMTQQKWNIAARVGDR